MRTEDIIKICSRPFRLERSVQTGKTPTFSHVELDLMFSTESEDEKGGEEIGRTEYSTNPMMAPGGRWIFGVADGMPQLQESGPDLFCWDAGSISSSSSSMKLHPCVSARFSKPVNRDSAVSMWSQGSADEPAVTIVVRYVDLESSHWYATFLEGISA